MTELNALFIVIHSHHNLGGGCRWYPHVINKKTEAQRLHNLVTVTELVNGRAGAETQTVGREARRFGKKSSH